MNMPGQHPEVHIGEVYQHYKGGSYIVLGSGEHTENREPLIFYISMQDGRGYHRPAGMFLGVVKEGNSYIQRFVLTGFIEIDLKINMQKG